jgi:hypothetical protein
MNLAHPRMPLNATQRRKTKKEERDVSYPIIYRRQESVIFSTIAVPCLLLAIVTPSAFVDAEVLLSVLSILTNCSFYLTLQG